MQNGKATLGTFFHLRLRLKKFPPHDSVILRHFYPKEMKEYVHKNTHITMFIASSFTRAPSWKTLNTKG